MTLGEGGRGQITLDLEGCVTELRFLFFRAKLLRYWKKGRMTWKGCYQKGGGQGPQACQGTRKRGPWCQKVDSTKHPLPPLPAAYLALASSALTSEKLPVLGSPLSWSDSWS